MTTPADDLSASPPAQSLRQRPRLDVTINVPTILLLLGMIAGTISSGLTLYANLSNRITGTATDLALYKTQADGDITSLKLQMAQSHSDQEQSRVDVKGDLHDINTKLDKLLWDRGDPRVGVQR